MMTYIPFLFLSTVLFLTWEETWLVATHIKMMIIIIVRCSPLCHSPFSASNSICTFFWVKKERSRFFLLTKVPNRFLIADGLFLVILNQTMVGNESYRILPNYTTFITVVKNPNKMSNFLQSNLEFFTIKSSIFHNNLAFF